MPSSTPSRTAGVCPGAAISSNAPRIRILRHPLVGPRNARLWDGSFPSHIRVPKPSSSVSKTSPDCEVPISISGTAVGTTRLPKVGLIWTSEKGLSVHCSVVQQPEVSKSALLYHPQACLRPRRRDLRAGQGRLAARRKAALLSCVRAHPAALSRCATRRILSPPAPRSRRRKPAPTRPPSRDRALPTPYLDARPVGRTMRRCL